MTFSLSCLLITTISVNETKQTVIWPISFLTSVYFSVLDSSQPGLIGIEHNYGKKEGRKEMFYLPTQSTHFN